MIMRLTDLPLDACDRLLLHMRDVASLRNIVLSSKRIYEVFKTRQRSIIQTVEFNEVGPALPQALVLVHTMTNQALLEEDLAELNKPDSNYCDANGTFAEALALQNVAVVARRLENHYSCLYKDRRASSSALTDDESFHFHRALYRAWMLDVLTRKPTTRYREPQFHYELELDFLSSISDEELQQMKEVVTFLGISHKTFGFAMDPSAWIAVLTVPEILIGIDGFELQRELVYDLTTIQMIIPFTLICISRSMSFVHNYDLSALPDSTICRRSSDDASQCDKCQRVTSLLFGPENRHFLPAYLSIEEVIGCLPGRLSENDIVNGLLTEIVKEKMFFRCYFNEMFNIQNDPESGWEISDVLCKECSMEFLTHNLFSWLVSRLTKDGYSFKENCWYGWNCRTQTHKYHHALKLNHLCAPTHKDDTSGIVV